MIYGGGARIRFDDDGNYETNDPRELRLLRRSRRVVEHGAGKSTARVVERSASISAKVGQKQIKAADYTREQLDEIAKAAGVDPSAHRTKGDLTDAINATR